MRRLSKTGKPITSDCDPFNLYCDTAMRRIAKLARRPRFIVSLRDPIRRAFSDFNMHRTNGERDARSFAQAIDDELSGVEKRFRKRFIHQSVYAPHVERLLATFPRDQLLIIKAEDLFSDPALIARQLFSFLELDPVPVDCSTQNRGTYSDPIDPASEDRLRKYFRPFNQRTYDLVGRDFGWDS
jgi:hypothetical protein